VGAMQFDRAGFDRDVGVRLQRARKERGITQAELAQRLGLPRPSYANIESGRQRVPLDVVWRAAVVLGVSITALVPEPLSRRRDAVLTNTMAFGTATTSSESMGFMPWRKPPEDSDR
jgi:transcriptional regulator with XRE-family HTH domain